ncbi:unnamed protein product, partial [Vitis vinifera]
MFFYNRADFNCLNAAVETVGLKAHMHLEFRRLL